MSSKLKFVIDDQTAITPELAEQELYDNQRSAESSTLKAFQGQMAIILELAQSEFARGLPTAIIVDRIANHLHQLRSQCGANVWKQLIPMAQNHPLTEFLFQDPSTHWSFQKPRGYSGDATLLDMLYRHPSTDNMIEGATPLGKEVYDYTNNAESSVAVRERLDILAQLVDATAQRTDSAEILSIACGHLREAEKSKALADGNLKRWVALDQDPQSITTVMQNCSSTTIRPIQGSVRGLLRRTYNLGVFDLVYAAGLYDYLNAKLGATLLQRCWELLKPEGTFMFANFSDEIETDGYMETFMDWPLILRNEDDLRKIVDTALEGKQAESRYYYGSNRYIVYAEVTKPA